ncbi:MAG: energy transducer TonB [Tannerella sp.]|jgi:protein TonB|nr:energy transducer TonB [Tannerella sp.]
MGKDINLYSQNWNDIIFENKNKAYGAYELRQTSTKRHLFAILGSLLIAAFVALLPLLIDTVKSLRPAVDNISTITELSALDELKEEVEEQDKIVEATEPPPPPLKSTLQFVEPQIVPADEIKEDEELKSQDELAESKLQISTQTIEGTDEEHGLDIAELEKHQEIAEVETEEIFTVVEQQAEFPGGITEMYKYLKDHINYPTMAQENNIHGKVYLKFVVSKDGSISQVTVVKGVDPSLDREAVRVVQSMPKWNPGKQNGKTVNVWFNLPVTFQLQ